MAVDEILCRLDGNSYSFLQVTGLGIIWIQFLSLTFSLVCLFFASHSFLSSVHDDVQLCQWLRTRDGRLKLGDFNRAEVMEFDIDKQKYCPYYNGDCYGNVSSSIEQNVSARLPTGTAVTHCKQTTVAFLCFRFLILPFVLFCVV